MTSEELLAIATDFDMGPEPIVMGKIDWWNPNCDSFDNVIVHNSRNPDHGKPDRWSIVKGGSFCLSKTGEWEWTPRNSEKTEDFFERCRYSSRDEAIEYYQRWKSIVETIGRMIMKSEGYVNYEDIPSELIKF